MKTNESHLDELTALTAAFAILKTRRVELANGPQPIYKLVLHASEAIERQIESLLR